MAALLGRLASAWLLFWLLGVFVPDAHFDWAYGLYAVVFVLACLGCTFGLPRTLRAFADPIQVASVDVRRCEENLEVVQAGKRYALVAVVFALLAGLLSVSQNSISPWLEISYWVVGAFQGWLIAFLLVDALGMTYREKRLASIEGRQEEQQDAVLASVASQYLRSFGSWFSALSPRRKIALVATVLVAFLFWSPFSDESPEAAALDEDLRVATPAHDAIRDVHRIELGTIRIWDRESGDVPTQYAVGATVSVTEELYHDYAGKVDSIADEMRRVVRLWLLSSGGVTLESTETQLTLPAQLEEHLTATLPVFRDGIERVYITDFEVTPWPTVEGRPVQAAPEDPLPMTTEMADGVVPESPARTSSHDTKGVVEQRRNGRDEPRGGYSEAKRLERWLDLPPIDSDRNAKDER